MSKLTAPQRLMLKRISNAEAIRYDENGFELRRARFAAYQRVLSNLLDAGLIDMTGAIHTYIITDAGRAALKDSKP